MVWFAFAVGLFLGAFFGCFVMAIIAVNREGYDE
jgi:hypothetical protein